MSFPLLNLPYVVICEVAKVMDPLEQLQLSQTSIKFGSFVKKQIKNPIYKLNNLKDTIFIINGERVSRIEVKFVKNYSENERRNWIYYKSKRAFMYTLETEKEECACFLGQLLLDSFDPHTISYDSKSLKSDNSRMWNLELFKWYSSWSSELYSKSKSSEEFQTSLKRFGMNLEHAFFNGVTIRDATWMSKEDFSVLMDNFKFVRVMNLPFSIQEMNQELLKWKEGKFRKLCFIMTFADGLLDCSALLHGLNAMEIDKNEIEMNIPHELFTLNNTTPYYRIETDDGRTGVIFGVGDHIYITDF